jgi:predicted lipoprotein with Yx(FWY)xxD motif
MKKNISISIFIFLGITLLLSACGSPATPTVVPLVSSPAHLAVGQNSSLGSFLTDLNGMTLYLFTTDSPGTSTCYGSCAVLWPPLLTSGAPVAGTGVNNAMLGTITRTDGTTQVTYNNWPLYYYQKDVKPGDITGEGVQGVWFVITPAGVQK